MKGDSGVIQHLNVILKNELTAINQYFLHSRLLENWGATKMARHEYEESIEEMQHADKLVQRIIMLDGHPNLQDLNRLHIGENVPEVIRADLDMEIQAVADLKVAIKHAESVQDYVTRDLFLQILRDEENHIDVLETQIQMIEDMGIANYLQLQSDAQGEGKKD